MIVSTILILFLPPLLLAQENFEIGPFHRSPPASIPRDSISSNLPTNQNPKSSPPELPRHDHKTPQIVHEGLINPQEKPDSVDPAAFQSKIVTDSPAEIQTRKPILAQSLHPVNTDSQDTSNYHIPKPVPNAWTPPKPPTLASVGLRRASQPVHVHPTSYVYQPQSLVTSVATEEPVSVDPSTLPPIIFTNSPEEIQTPKSSQPNAPHLIIYADNEHQDSGTHVPKPVWNSWITPGFNRIPTLDSGRASAPNTAVADYGRTGSYLYQTHLPVAPSTENSLVQNKHAVPDSDGKIFSTDQVEEIQTQKPSLSSGNKRLDSYFVPRPASSPWRPREHFTNSSEDMRASQPNTPQSIHVDNRRHMEIGPYHRPQRSAAPWDDQIWDSFVEDQILQSNTQQRFMCPQAHGYFKYTDKCHEYIECKNYVPLAYTCPPGLHFNPQVEWTEYPCDHPSNVQCNEELTLPTTTTPPAPTPSPKVVTTPRPNKQKPEGFTCHQPHGYFKFNDQCEEYIECKNYVPLMFTCPVGLHFNPRVEWTEYPCEHPSIVLCERDPIDEDTPRTTRIPPPPPTTRPPPPPTTRPPPPPTTRPPPPPTTRPPPPPTTRPPPPPTTRPPPPPTTRPPPSPTTRPPPPPTTRPPPPPTTRPPPPPTTRPPRPTTRRPPPPTTRRPPPPPTTRRPPPPPTTRRPPPPSTTRRPPPPPTTRRPTPPPTTRLPPPPPTTRRPLPPPTTTPLPIITSPKNPPDYNVCLQPYGYFKFSDHCGEYIECKNYVPLIFTCPVGLHFNTLADWTEYPCDHPSKVQCNGNSLQPTVPPTTQAPPATSTPFPLVTTPHPGSKLLDFKCPQAHGYFKHNDQCSEYIECKNHVPLTYTCPGGLHFNVYVDWTEYPCDLPSNVQCNKEPGTKQPSENPQPIAVTPNIPRFPIQEKVHRPTERTSYEPIDFYCQEPNGYYSVASQCDTYIECKDFKAIKHFCPAGLHFSSKVQWPDFPCNYPSRVQCINGPVIDDIGTPRPTVRTPRPTVVTQPPTAGTPLMLRFPTQETERPSHELIDFYCQEPNAYYSVASQCDTYIECKNNRAIQHVCPDGLHFDPKAQWPKFPCNYPSRVQCNKGPVIDNSNLPVRRPDIDIRRPNFGTPRPTIRTAQPTVVTQAPTARMPRFPTQETVRPPTELPSHELLDFYCQEPNAYYSVASQCDTYIECKDYKAIKHICPGGLHFDPKAQWPKFPCNYPSRVQCNNRSVIDDSSVPVTRPDVGTPRFSIVTYRPTVITPRPTVVTSRPHAVTLFTPPDVREETVRPLPSKQFFNYSCPESNGFYSVASKCDVYVECKSDIAIEHSCPDGLHFNPNVQWPDYPCSYPSEVQCGSEDVVQPASPTVNCPHREGFFPTASDDCGEYMVCHAGVAIIKHCPAGLVFNFEKDTCDWPIDVPSCNQARALEGFVCPVRSVDEDGLRIYKYRYGHSCKNFIACQEGQPRLLSCDAGLHFNEETESCVDSTLVVDCDRDYS